MWLAFIISIKETVAVPIEGEIDVLPFCFIADRNTPYAIHFSAWTTDFIGYSAVSAKLRVLSGNIEANSFTWSTVAPAGWRDDNDVAVLLNPVPISNGTVSGWLFGKSASSSYFGASTCRIRIYRGKTAIYYDLIASVPFYAVDTRSQAGWIAGVRPELGAKVIVLAKDSHNNILGAYITEDNEIFEQGYPRTTGYFKIGVPVGEVARLEFRNWDNQIIGSITGPWTINPGKVTEIPLPSSIDSEDWVKYK